MNTQKLALLLAASLFSLACADEAKPGVLAKPERSKASPGAAAPGYQTKKAPYERPSTHTAPKPVMLDVGPADLLDWQIKATAEAQGKIEGCAGFQALQAKNPGGISISTHKEISPSMPFWVFAIQEKAGEQTTTLNYCTLLATTAAITCDPIGAAVCP